MGSCLQSLTISTFLRTKQPKKIKNSLLFSSTHNGNKNISKNSNQNSEQLRTIIKQSTHNNRYFYSADNLGECQAILESCLKGKDKEKASIGHTADRIKQNIEKLQKFIRQLKERNSEIGEQYNRDNQRIKEYVERNKIQLNVDKIGMGIMFRLELQVLLLSGEILEEMADGWDFCIQISEKIKEAKDGKDKGQVIDRIWVSDYFKKKILKTQGGLSKTYNPHQTQLTQLTNQSPIRNSNQNAIQPISQIQQVSIFHLSSKIIQKTSKITLSLFKLKRKKFADPQSPFAPCPSHSQLASLCLCPTDFIYHSSLLITDILPLSPPVNSSISTQISSSSASQCSHIGYLSLRGQALPILNYQAQYMKIIKQHQIVLRQLKLCAEGGLKWEEWKNSRESSKSGKGDSYYSQYSYTGNQKNRYRM